MKLYESIKRPDNYGKNKVPLKQGEYITIQEKIDGSNTSIYNDNGKLRLFSRTNEITNSKDNFQDFINFVKKNEDNILKHLKNQWVIFGEWLGQGKIPYNKKAKNGLIPQYYVFDIAYKINNMFDEDKIERYYLRPTESILLAELMHLEFVPVIEKEIEFNNYEEIRNNYVNGKMSIIDNESIREGVVIKNIASDKRIKIVAEQFSEVKSIKFKNTNDLYSWLEKYITPMRIQKFLLKVQSDLGIDINDKENYKEIFKKMDLLSDDIISEEKEEILEKVGKIIRKIGINLIKEFLEKDGKEKNE